MVNANQHILRIIDVIYNDRQNVDERVPEILKESNHAADVLSIIFSVRETMSKRLTSLNLSFSEEHSKTFFLSPLVPL